MRGSTVMMAVALAAITIGTIRLLTRGDAKPRVTNFTPAEEEPVCPWREPDNDLHSFFPEATSHHLETKALSAMRPQLMRILGRQPTGADHILHVHRVMTGGAPAGAVLLKRVKGEYGAIELVIALSTNNIIRGVRAQ